MALLVCPVSMSLLCMGTAEGRLHRGSCPAARVHQRWVGVCGRTFPAWYSGYDLGNTSAPLGDSDEAVVDGTPKNWSTLKALHRCTWQAEAWCR